MSTKATLKKVLGELPLAAEVYWQIQGGKPLSKSFSLKRTEKWLAEWVSQAQTTRPFNPPGKKVMLFATLRYWIEHAGLVGLALAGLGHEVSLTYLPYANWKKPINRFDLRRQNAYARKVYTPAASLLHTVSLMEVKPEALPAEIEQAVEEISTRDVQYTLQVEDFDRDGELFSLRLERNRAAAGSALAWMQANQPQVLITPNGSILEMGAIYAVARYLNVPVVTYEFGEQKGRIWLARNAEVMRQNTDELWQQFKDKPLSEAEEGQVHALFASRQRASLWQNFSRRWQGQPSQGGEAARQALNLDDRPIVLLAANVIGDSLTLGRQVFTDSMTEWLQRTVLDFARRPQAQLVVRIHPGERYTKGPSVADVVAAVMPEPPEHIHLVAAGDPINTYDLMEVANLGLVYTTTVGMEMAMSGVPVIVAGKTHYRGRGFTLDPDSWESYSDLLDAALASPQSLTPEQVDLAWRYAHRFFFDYPLPFPWHLLHFWEELEEQPMARVLSVEGQKVYGETFRALVGERREWRSPVHG